MKTKLPLGRQVRILARHNLGLLALDKPAGIRSHPNKAGIDRNALLLAPFDLDSECYELEEGQKIHLLHRLDSPTSGILLLSLDSELAREIKQMWKTGKVHKEYRARVFGRMTRREMHWQDHLDTRRQHGRLRTQSGKGIPAHARCQSLKTPPTQPATNLLALFPTTGRTHQLRIQCARRKLPIVGDATYGDFNLNRVWSGQYKDKRLHLHCHRIQLSLPGSNGNWNVESPVPEDL